ncbi:hypothetical protein [Cupriavidus campinensis]|uniref:hypothetical protein n=1 Tax=Cupriavidus campinensis TaxID=151783 RepID=UPI00292A4453|nr:hypothetical protein [Cupriavidus campinensis]
MKTLFRPILTLATAAVAAALSGCAPTSPAAPQVAPQVTPINATIKLGRVIERTYLTRVEVPDGAATPAMAWVWEPPVSAAEAGMAAAPWDWDFRST